MIISGGYKHNLIKIFYRSKDSHHTKEFHLRTSDTEVIFFSDISVHVNMMLYVV